MHVGSHMTRRPVWEPTPPLKPCMRISRTRLTSGRSARSIARPALSSGAAPGSRSPRLPEVVSPQRCTHDAWKLLPPGARLAAAQSCLRSCRTLSFDSSVDGVVRHGLAGHSLALTRSISMTTAGTLPSSRVMPHGLRRCGLHLTVRYYDPLGLPLRTPRLRLGLIRARLPRLGPRRRASHVPHLSLHTCCAPYPAAVTFALRISLG